MNRILKRLINKHLAQYSDDHNIASFVGEIESIFKQHNDERKFMERTLTLSSEELNEINQSLKENLVANERNQIYLETLLAKQHALFDASTEAVFSFNNDNEIDNMNQAGVDFLCLSEADLQQDVLTCDLFMARLADQDKFNKDIQPIRDEEHAKVQGVFQGVDNRFYQYYSVPELVEGKKIGRVWCCRDITEIRKNEELLIHQATHDELTGLPNRSMIMESLNHAVKMAERHRTKVGVLFIDLDDFKKINDTAGHQEGDRYLQEFTLRVSSALKRGDIIGRLGGDEFVVILEDIKTINDVVLINERILELCKIPFFINDKKYHMSCSIGISMTPCDSLEAEELIRKADMAMYQAKKTGKNTYHFFDEQLEKVALDSVIIEGQLREAIKHDQFVLHFQPKHNLDGSALYGVEALIRWQKSENELIYPDRFVPIAEQNGLIRDLTYWVMENVCKTLRDWQKTPMANVAISLNISAIDFSDPNFVKQLFELTDNYQVDPKLIELELTESVFFDDIAAVQATIQQLKARNVKLSIDDFGTGFSSFSYLRDMDVDFLKIDRSFVMGAHKDVKSQAIVRSIIDIGTNLGFKVVAEGIESVSDFNLLASEGCHLGQGYFMSKPLPEKQLINYYDSLVRGAANSDFGAQAIHG